MELTGNIKRISFRGLIVSTEDLREHGDVYDVDIEGSHVAWVTIKNIILDQNTGILYHVKSIEIEPEYNTPEVMQFVIGKIKAILALGIKSSLLTSFFLKILDGKTIEIYPPGYNQPFSTYQMPKKIEES